MLLGLKLPPVVVGQYVLEVLQDALVIDTGGLLLLEARAFLLEAVLVAALGLLVGTIVVIACVGVVVAVAIARVPALEGHPGTLQALLAALQLLSALGTALLAIAMLADLQGSGWRRQRC